MLYETAMRQTMFLPRQVNMKMCLSALSTHEQERQTEMILGVTSYPQTSPTYPSLHLTEKSRLRLWNV